MRVKATNEVTVREVWRLALPEETELLAGHASLDRVVSWACAMRPIPPAFPRLEGHELALINADDLRYLDDLPLAQVIRGLHQANVSAIAVLGPVDEAAIAVAQETQMPLFALPAEVMIAAVEREIIRLIVDREASLERFRSQISHQLAEIAMADRGWRALADALARASRKTVVIQDAMLRVCGLGPGPSPQLPLQVGEVDGLVEPTVLPAGDGDIGRLVFPICVEGEVVGYLSLLGPPGGFDASDRIVAQEGALHCALQLAKERAISGAERQRRARFLADLLSGRELDPIVLARQASAFQYDPSPPQIVLTLGTVKGEGPDAEHLARRVQEELTHRRVAGFVAVRPASTAPVLALFPLSGEAPARAGRRLAHALLEALARQFPQIALVGGLSRPLYTLREAKEAVEEAEQAWSLGCRLVSDQPFQLVDASELGVYRLLLPLEGTPALRTFYQETLSLLEAYDQRHGTHLVHTLEVYFSQLGNLSRTAEVLHLHRNTLIYRLERISAVLGVDLEDAEVRLRLQLALKVRQLLRERARREG